MKKKHKKSKNNFLKILLVLAALVVAAVIIAQFVDFNKIFAPEEEPAPTKVEPTNTPTPTPAPTPEPTPEPTQTPAADPEPAKPETPQYDGQDPNTNDAITGVITYAGVSGGNLMIRVNIDQYLSGGTCNLILSQNDAAVFGAAAAIVDAASTSTCEGFNVSLGELQPGKYRITINLSSGRKTGTITGEVNI